MRFLLFVAFLCLTPRLCAAQEGVQAIDMILSRQGREDSFSGNVLISERGRIIYEKSFGYADAAGRRPLTADSLFLVGSVAKNFTATAVFILKERGALALDDSVTKYLPELPYRNVTLRHLLAHTSGLPEYQWDSLGEAYYQAGDRDAAVRNYEKSLRINSNNAAGRRMLEKIRGEKGNL